MVCTAWATTWSPLARTSTLATGVFLTLLPAPWIWRGPLWERLPAGLSICSPGTSRVSPRMRLHRLSRTRQRTRPSEQDLPSAQLTSFTPRGLIDDERYFVKIEMKGLAVFDHTETERERERERERKRETNLVFISLLDCPVSA